MLTRRALNFLPLSFCSRMFGQENRYMQLRQGATETRIKVFQLDTLVQVWPRGNSQERKTPNPSTEKPDNEAFLKKRIEQLEETLELEARQLIRWCAEARAGGWSTQHVDPMKARAVLLLEILEDRAWK